MNVLQVWKGAVLAQNSGCEATVNAYLYALEEFCNFCDTTPEEILRECESVVSYDERRFSRKWNMKIKEYTAWLSGLAWDGQQRN